MQLKKNPGQWKKSKEQNKFVYFTTSPFIVVYILVKSLRNATRVKQNQESDRCIN